MSLVGDGRTDSSLMENIGQIRSLRGANEKKWQRNRQNFLRRAGTLGRIGATGLFRRPAAMIGDRSERAAYLSPQDCQAMDRASAPEVASSSWAAGSSASLAKDVPPSVAATAGGMSLSSSNNARSS
jgi:hypothetical protein